MNRKAKIVATIGPTSETEAVIEKLLLAGMDAARLNFSHGEHAEHALRTSRLRAVAARLGRPLAILQDLQGPKIRVGALTVPVALVQGKTVFLYPEGSPQPPTANGQLLTSVH